MKHYIVGTAGHVDHGKSTLIRALTGVETDRLPEEKQRGLSIDLGFAALDLGDDIHAGVVDVPGHQRFLKNMLAGVGGYDLGLLVVDAQESVMPQTREHVEILSLLHTRKGVVALTKVDLIDDDFAELVEDELEEFLLGTFLEGAPIVRVSGTTGQGLDRLRDALRQQLSEIEPRDADQPFRLPIDRVFSKTGFGTVVTGSLWSGRLTVGDTVEILPEQTKARVRGLQCHGEAAETAVAGQRVAVNLSGVEPGSLGRGQVVAPPGLMQPTDRLDVRLDVLAKVPRPLKHRAPLRFYAGTTEALGRVLLLEGEAIAPGDSALAQIELREPLGILRDDHFIVRDSTGQYTLGGGVVLVAVAQRHARHDAEAIAALEKREQGGPEEAVLTALSAVGAKTLAALATELQMSQDELRGLVETMEAEGRAVRLGKMVAQAGVADTLMHRLLGLVTRLHEAAPWKVGWKKEELLKLLDCDKPVLGQGVLAEALRRGDLVERRALIGQAGWQPSLNKGQQQVADQVIEHLRSCGFSPTAWKDLEEKLKLPGKIWKLVGAHLLETQQAARVSDTLVFLEETLAEGRRSLAELEAGFTASEAREKLDTTRKFIIPLLEYYDQMGFTQRAGDKRVIRRAAAKG